jgi:hypothetical protein
MGNGGLATLSLVQDQGRFQGRSGVDFYATVSANIYG